MRSDILFRNIFCAKGSLDAHNIYVAATYLFFLGTHYFHDFRSLKVSNHYERIKGKILKNRQKNEI